MSTTLYVSDLDGTLLGPDSRISDATLEILNPLIRSGAMFTVATARTPATVSDLLRGVAPACDTHGHDLPAITMTGAALWNRHLKRYDSVELLTTRERDIILDAFHGEGVVPFDYRFSPDGILQVYHPGAMSRRENDFYQERRHLALKRFHPGETAPETLPTVLFFAMGEPDRIDRLSQRIRRLTGCAAAWYRDIFNPEVALMDVYAPGVSKAEAVRRVARNAGADRIVVFGDNLNDLPMMEVADVAVAVANALPGVREAADVVIGPNTEPSVARWIAADLLPSSPHNLITS